MITGDNRMDREEILAFLDTDTSSEEMRSIEEELFKDLDPADMFRAHKEDLAELNRSQKLLEDMKASYDPEKHSRAYVEDHYLLHRDILFHLARRFHPLSDYGKEMLERAIECRKEFEEKYGTLISAITKENAELFSEVLSEDIADEIRCGRSRGIGALKSDEEGTCAAGALAYHIDTDPVDDDPILRVNWLYVDRDCREMGVAGSLIGELVYQMIRFEKISAMTVDYPAGITESEVLGNLLQEWHFSFTTGLSPDFICSISDIKTTDELEKYSSKANAMEDVKEKDLRIKGFPEGTFDRKLSFYTGSIKDPDSILLGYLRPSGLIRAEYIYCKPGSEIDFLFLVSAFLCNAVRKYPPITEIAIPIAAEEAGEALDKLIPSQKTELMVEGILMHPDDAENLTGADVTELLNSLDQ